MSDLIKREDAIKAVVDCRRWHFYEILEVTSALIDLPSADIDLSEYSDKLWKNAYERGKEEEHRWWTEHCANCTDADRPQGEWIPSDTDGFVCSVCKNGYRNQPTLMGRPMFEYCPVCGARMKGADDE